MTTTLPITGTRAQRVKATRKAYNAIAAVCIDHAAIRQLAAEGYHPFLIAKAIGLGFGCVQTIIREG